MQAFKELHDGFVDRSDLGSRVVNRDLVVIWSPVTGEVQLHGRVVYRPILKRLPTDQPNSFGDHGKRSKVGTPIELPVPDSLWDEGPFYWSQ